MKARNSLILVLSAVLAFCAGAQSSSPGDGFILPREGPASQVIGSPLNLYEPPPPRESALWEGRWNSAVRTRVHAGAMVGMFSSLALSAGGIGVLFSGAGNGPDTQAMHNGILMAVTGSLFSSLFTILFEATGGTPASD